MSESGKASDLLRSVDRGLRVTGIGSVPFLDPDEACDLILKHCPMIPYVPQLLKRDPRESMFLQFAENLPCLGVNYKKMHVFFDRTRDMGKELDRFYDNLKQAHYDWFRISPEYCRSLPVLLEKCRTSANPFVKTQVTGPVTYLMSLAKGDKRPLIYDDALAEAVTLGLAMKGLWQANEIKKIGKTPLLFLDEPSLSELGSAYMPITTEKARSFVDGFLGFIRKRDRDLLVGLHCCGNTDWGMILESGVDIVSLDSYSCGDKLMLYPKETSRFLKRGGFIAFGLVPTSEYGNWITENALYDQFMSILTGFEERGIPRGELLDHAIFTPACGTGPLRPRDARRILELVASLAGRIQDR
jgi:hypothetical protein